MVSYSVHVKKSAEKELRGIPKSDLQKTIHRIQSLVQNPRPPGCEKLSNTEKYRIRERDWRVIYWISNDHHLVEIVKIAHRREVYR
jgi:mRNA interferase RelE/StbE